MKTQMEVQFLAVCKAIIDQAKDGVDRSAWILKQAKLALGLKELI